MKNIKSELSQWIMEMSIYGFHCKLQDGLFFFTSKNKTFYCNFTVKFDKMSHYSYHYFSLHNHLLSISIFTVKLQ